MDIMDMTLCQAVSAVKEKKVTAVELTKASMSRIEKNKSLNAFNCVAVEQALEQAKQIDKKIAAQLPCGQLCGVPIGVKDNIATKGIATTCSSKMLQHFVPPYHATVVEKLLKAEAVIVGKTNMDEFAMGSSNENSFFGAVKNPIDITRVPGGSSGGSAAAVCDKEVFASLGSDTGGSIRQPASFCGIVGIKPTYGYVSRFGLIAFASSLDQIGTFGRNVKDAALLLNVVQGYDEKDSTSQKMKEPVNEQIFNGSVKGLKIGIPKEFFAVGLDAEVSNCVTSALQKLQQLGAQLIELSLPYTEELISVYYIISSAEAASNLARFDGVKYGFRAEHYKDIVDLYVESRTQGFGSEVKRRIMLGNYVLSSGYYDAYYRKAMQARMLMKQAYADAFQKCDVIAGPTCPTTAFRLGEKSKDPLQMYLSDVYTVSCNIIGSPGISLPCGTDKNKLPIGLQLVGRPFEEKVILNAAECLERCGGCK